MAREQLRVAYELVAPTRRVVVRSAPEEKPEAPLPHQREGRES